MTAESHTQLFQDALSSDWQTALGRDEWYFVSLIDDITLGLKPSDAFIALDEVLRVLLHQRDPTLTYYCASFFLSLSRRSNTTELPNRLEDNWAALTDQLHDHPDLLNQLKDWYRLP